MNKENKLLDLTQKILLIFANEGSFRNQEEKDSAMDMLQSMEFFVDQGDFDRAISEGENLINKVEENFSEDDK